MSVVTWYWSAQRSGGRPLGRRHDDGGWRPNYGWIGCRVVDDICARKHPGAVCGLLPLLADQQSGGGLLY